MREVFHSQSMVKYNLPIIYLIIRESVIDLTIISVFHPKTILTMQNYKQITLQLEKETLDRLKDQAMIEGDRPVASLIREILLREIGLGETPEDRKKTENET